MIVAGNFDFDASHRSFFSNQPIGCDWVNFVPEKEVGGDRKSLNPDTLGEKSTNPKMSEEKRTNPEIPAEEMENPAMLKGKMVNPGIPSTYNTPPHPKTV